MKNVRQEKILELIRTSPISTQEDLIEALAKNGIRATQATISRDMKQLRLTKQSDAHGTMRYVVTTQKEHMAISDKLEKILKECVTHCDFAQNMVVIKTLPGLASAAASALDHMQMHTVVGTLAGDDTVFLVMRDESSAQYFCEQIHLQIG